MGPPRTRRSFQSNARLAGFSASKYPMPNLRPTMRRGGSIPGNSIARGQGTGSDALRVTETDVRFQAGALVRFRTPPRIRGLGNHVPVNCVRASRAHKGQRQCEFCCRCWLWSPSASGPAIRKDQPNEPARTWTMLVSGLATPSIHPRAQRRARGGSSTGHWAIDTLASCEPDPQAHKPAGGRAQGRAQKGLIVDDPHRSRAGIIPAGRQPLPCGLRFRVYRGVGGPRHGHRNRTRK